MGCIAGTATTRIYSCVKCRKDVTHKLVMPGHFTKFFDSARDLDKNGVSSTVDDMISEFVADGGGELELTMHGVVSGGLRAPAPASVPIPAPNRSRTTTPKIPRRTLDAALARSRAQEG